MPKMKKKKGAKEPCIYDVPTGKMRFYPQESKKTLLAGRKVYGLMIICGPNGEKECVKCVQYERRDINGVIRPVRRRIPTVSQRLTLRNWGAGKFFPHSDLVYTQKEKAVKFLKEVAKNKKEAAAAYRKRVVKIAQEEGAKVHAPKEVAKKKKEAAAYRKRAVKIAQEEGAKGAALKERKLAKEQQETEDWGRKVAKFAAREVP